MSINLTVPQTMQELRPRITVIGVGGAGCNAVNNMINANLDGVDFLVANTDGQALAHSLAPRKIQLGTNLTAGLGAGSKPDIGKQAAEESMSEVIAELQDCNMVFITAGMGGGTGTGAAPVIAQAARQAGILTVGVVTKPFEFEGSRRMKQANAGIEQLAAHVDTLIIVPNQNLFHVTSDRTTFTEAFNMADEVLHQGVSGVTDLMLKPGIINLDFADIRSVMTEMGKAMMGTGEASGENRAILAAETAINNPLLEDTSLRGAKALIVNVTGGPELGFYEVDEAVQRIRKEIDEDANLIFGSAIDQGLEGTIRVSVVATGIDSRAMQATPPQTTMPTSFDNIKAPEATSSPMATSPIMTSEDSTSLPVMDADIPQMEARLDSDVPVMMGDVPQDHMMDDMLAEPAETPALTEAAATDLSDIVEQSPSAQLDLEEAVANVDEPSSEDDTHAIEQIIDPLADSSIKASQEESFIPSPALSVDSDDVVTNTAPIPESRPSLIRQISGLWRPRQKASEDQSETAGEATANVMPDVKETSQEPAILNLSRGAALQESLPIGNLATEESHEADDELDIPAFLRRQAN